MQNQKFVDATRPKQSGYQRVVNKIGQVAVVTATGVTVAHANTGLDMSSATTQFVLALAALGALGAAKLAPAALSWVWAIVIRNASRG